MTKLLAGLFVVSLMGCASAEQQPITTEAREFTFDYQLPGKSKAEIFKAAQQHLALSYGDVRAVSRTSDSEDGTFIGKAIVPWNLSVDGLLITSISCASNYNIIFIAKDGKARLQLTLLEGSAAPVSCGGWALPPKRDYPQIVASFNATSKRLEEALQGTSKIDKLRDF